MFNMDKESLSYKNAWRTVTREYINWRSKSTLHAEDIVVTDAQRIQRFTDELLELVGEHPLDLTGTRRWEFERIKKKAFGNGLG